jgi:hypothetical protein
VSGTKARRPALDKMMEDCTATQIRCRGRLGVRPSGEVNQAPAASARRTERIRHPVPQPARSHRHRGSAWLGDHRVVSASLIVEKSSGRNAKGQARRSATWTCTAGHQPGASCRRSSFGNVVDCCGQKARNQPRKRMQVDEGVQREFPCRRSLEVWSPHRSASFALGDYPL